MTLPTVILPGYLAGAIAYRDLEQALNQQGIPTVTVPLRWQDWLPTLGGRTVSPILRQIDQTVRQVQHTTGATKVNLIGHSAGGWIARIYLGDTPYAIHPQDSPETVWKARSRVHTLLTLGTPHTSQERWTRKNLEFVNQTYPDAFYPDVRYVCVAGKAILGARRPGAWLAFNSYKLTCGEGDCWGDGITPIAAAHLNGAKNLVIDQATHSPKPGKLWYGSPELLSQWVEYLA